MSGERSIARVLVCLWAAALLCTPAQAIDVRGDLSALGQVRDGDQSRQTEAPTDLYGDVGVSGLHHGSSLETYFRLERDFGLNQTTTDFYAGSLRVPGAIPGVDFTLGRQVLSEVPGGIFTADGGKVRIDPGWPVAFSLFGGQPRYFEPTTPTPTVPSRDEQIFGGSVRTTRWKNGYLSLGFLQQDREQRTLRQLVSFSGARSFTQLPGLPNVYSLVSYDADHQNLDQATAGFDAFLSQPRLSVNFESSYYKPQDNGKQLVTDINRREDPIFQVFSVSQMLQFRGGLRYALTRSLSAYGDYSYQRYEKQASIFENGHVGSVGVLWLPGGDGLEVVKLEYYVLDSGGGNVNGAKLYYESRVYKRIVFRSKIDTAYYEKENNQRDTAFSSFLGLGYVMAPGLVTELNFEANHNQRFNEDFRVGFQITYNFRYRSYQPLPATGQPAGGKPS